MRNRIVILTALPLIYAGLATTASAADQEQAAAATAAASAGASDPLFLSATNGATNYLTVINTGTKQITYVPTGGIGGASGNADGIAVQGKIAAVINFGSRNVTIFVRRGHAADTDDHRDLATGVGRVGNGHLVVLGQTTAQSFPVYGNTVETQADGEVPLLLADKSAAQIVTFDGGVAYSEKTGSVAEVSLSSNGMPGLSTVNQSIPLPAAPNNMTPFALAGRGANLYLAIAHSDLETLVVNGQVVSTAAGPSPSGGITHAPCWNTLSGQFLFASDSPGKQVLRFLVSDTNIFFDKPSIATFAGAPTDLTANGTLLGVIDGGTNGVSDASLFDIGSEGEVTLRFAVQISGPINGAAIID